MAFNNKVGSGFTNIQKYLGANQQNKLGSAIGSGIQNQVQQTKGNLNTAQNQFQDQLSSNKFNSEEGKNLISGASNPDAVTDESAKRFQQLKAGGYAGPQALNNADQLKGQAQQTKQEGQATGTTSGRYGLLQKYAGRGQYNQGQQRLDNLILGQTGQQDLNQARRATAGIDNQVSGAVNVAGQQAQQAATNNQQVGQELGGALDKANTDVYNEADAMAEQQRQIRAGNAAKFEQTRSHLDNAKNWLDQNSGKNLADYFYQPEVDGVFKINGEDPNRLSGADLKTLGFGDDAFLDTLKVGDLQNILKSKFDLDSQAKNVSAGQVATEEQLKRAQALAKLGATNPKLVKDNNAIQDLVGLENPNFGQNYMNSDEYKNKLGQYNQVKAERDSAQQAFFRDLGADPNGMGGRWGLNSTNISDAEKTALVNKLGTIVGNQGDTAAELGNLLAQKGVDMGGASPREFAARILNQNSSTEHGGIGMLQNVMNSNRFKRLSDLFGGKSGENKL